MEAVRLSLDRSSHVSRLPVFSSKQKVVPHKDFPDPRLFDYDKNGRVDASDVIQERSAREAILSKVETTSTVKPEESSIDLFA